VALTRRGRIVAGVLTVAIVTGISAVIVSRGPHILIPADPCRHPPPLETYRGVTLQPIAMTAFRQAQRAAGRRIDVRQSYRSCAQQVLACQRICHDPRGCPQTCARPGSSYHQLGAAIDISEAALRVHKVVQALREAGWCQSVPKTDPGHFSFGGCH
jgi:hypothetical protein